MDVSPSILYIIAALIVWRFLIVPVDVAIAKWGKRWLPPIATLVWFGLFAWWLPEDHTGSVQIAAQQANAWVHTLPDWGQVAVLTAVGFFFVSAWLEMPHEW